MLIPMSWKDKFLDAVIDRNVFYVLVFIPVLWLAVPADKRLEAFGILTGFAFAGGGAKTVMNGLKAKAAIQAGGPATSLSTTTTTTETKGEGNG